MASITDLISRVRFFIDEPTQQNFTDKDITYALNVAQQDVAKEIVHEYEDYFEKQADLNPSGGGTIPGVALYTLPTDFLKFKRIERTDTGETIHPIDYNEKVTTGNGLVNLVSPGGVMSYAIVGNNLVLDPPPASVVPVRLTYVYRLADLDTVVNTTSDVPAEHHDMIAVRAAIDMFIKDESDTSALQDRWLQLLNQLQRTLRQRQIQEPKRVRSVQSHGILY